MRKLWGWLRGVRGRLRYWRPAPARLRQLEEWQLGWRETNRMLVKAGLSDKTRIAALERELLRLQQEQSAMLCEVPGLTPGEIERLAILADECGAVARAIGKVLRFGWESQSPYRDDRTNRVVLEREVGSVRAAVNLMLDEDDLRLSEVQTWQRVRRASLVKWTLYQECSMPREEQLAMMRAIADSSGD